MAWLQSLRGQLFFFKIYFIFNYVCVSEGESVHVIVGLAEAKGISSSTAGVTGVCEPLDISAWN